MSTNLTTTIDIDEIRIIFKDDCKEENEKFDDKEFQKFLEFLEIDFYDWVRGNLRQFNKQ